MTPLEQRCRETLEGSWIVGERDGVPFAYTRPSPGRYSWQWYWDSCFAAIAWRHFDAARSRAELETLLAAARPDGFIGHTIFWEHPVSGPRRLFYNVIHHDDVMTATIEPPALAFAWRVAVGDPALEPRIVAHHVAVSNERDLEGDGLVWILQPDESGLDASPQFDPIWRARAQGLPGFVELVARNREREFRIDAVRADGDPVVCEVLTNVIHGLSRLALGLPSITASGLGCDEISSGRRSTVGVERPTREEQAMSLPEIASREEWIRARVALLEHEKALTRARDELAAERRRLPMVEVATDYRFTAADGSSRTLLDLFEGRHQLIVDHYMFDPDWEDGCMSCAGRVDQYGNTAHLHQRDTTIAVVSRAPIEKIERWKHKMGWTFPWYSSYGSRFNFDYGVSFDDTVDDPHYNYRSADELKAKYALPELPSELHGTSVFLRVGDRVFHTYSTYGRGTEQVGGTHYYLDMTALGRQEDWEEPKGRAKSLGPRADQRAAPAASAV
jgi:predicted dithiol-disulfide oxidoreductase (DUF899 family)